MTPSHTTKNGKLRYRYYTCCSAQKKGWKTCPSKSVPAGPIEAFVIDRIRCIGRDPDLLNEVLAQARVQVEGQIAELESEERGLQKELAAWQKDVGHLSARFQPGEASGEVMGRLADLNQRIDRAEERLTAGAGGGQGRGRGDG